MSSLQSSVKAAQGASNSLSVGEYPRNTGSSAYVTRLSRNQSKSCLIHTLPGEIRNRIYEYVYDLKRTAIIRPNSPLFESHPLSSNFVGKPTAPKATRCLTIKTSQKSTQTSTLVIHKTPGTDLLPVEGITWKSSPISLLLTCKSISDEAAGFLYANTSFFFEDATRLDAFIKVTKRKNLLQIKRLKLFIKAYGIPSARVDTQWEHKHLTRWMSTLETVITAMPNIDRLHLHMHFADISGFLGRAFRSVNPDLGPFLAPQAFSKLLHLKRVSVYTTSQLLCCSGNSSLMSDMYVPHFEVQGIYHPSHLQKQIVFLANKIKTEELHDALNLGIKKMIKDEDYGELLGGGDKPRCEKDANAWSTELKVAVKDWEQWARDPVGNSLRAAGPLPPPGVVHFTAPTAPTAPAAPPILTITSGGTHSSSGPASSTTPGSTVTTIHTITAATSDPPPPPASVANETRPARRENKNKQPRERRQNTRHATSSTTPASAPIAALQQHTAEVSNPVLEDSAQALLPSAAHEGMPSHLSRRPKQNIKMKLDDVNEPFPSASATASLQTVVKRAKNNFPPLPATRNPASNRRVDAQPKILRITQKKKNPTQKKKPLKAASYDVRLACLSEEGLKSGTHRHT